MLVFLSFVVLVLAGAVVLLFAMLGELTSRLPTLGVNYRDPEIAPLPDARLGAAPEQWPPALDNEPELLLVLSTACASCEDVAAQISQRLDAGPIPGAALLVSCGEASTGRDFLDRHGLARMPTYVDEGGAWVSNSFGVRHSPTALVLQDSHLKAALVFTDFAALQTTITNDYQVVPA